MTTNEWIAGTGAAGGIIPVGGERTRTPASAGLGRTDLPALPGLEDERREARLALLTQAYHQLGFSLEAARAAAGVDLPLFALPPIDWENAEAGEPQLMPLVA